MTVSKGAVPTVDKLVLSLQRRGVTLWAQDGQLCFQAPKGTLTDGDLAQLRDSKAEIMRLLEQAPAGFQAGYTVVERQAPLSAMQRQWWNYIQEQQDGMTERLCYSAVLITGPLVTKFLRRSLDIVLQRHEALRTRVTIVDGVPRQQIEAHFNCPFESEDLRELSAPDRHRHGAIHACEFVRRRITLTEGPLFAAKLLRLSEREYLLILALEHMVTDGASNAVLLRDLLRIYSGLVRGAAAKLPELAMQFADYAIWQEQTSAQWRQEHQEYWRHRLSGAPRVRLPLDEFPQTSAPPRYSTVKIAFGAELSARLHRLARRARTVPAIIGLTIYVTAIHRWCRESDLLLLFVSNGRFRPELHDMIGFLTSHIHLRLTVLLNDTFDTLLQRCNQELANAYEHYDFDRVPELFGDSETELYFNWESASEPGAPFEMAADGPNELMVTNFPLDVSWSRRFLPLFYDTADGIIVELTYRSDSIGQSSIAKFRDHLLAAADEFELSSPIVSSCAK